MFLFKVVELLQSILDVLHKAYQRVYKFCSKIITATFSPALIYSKYSWLKINSDLNSNVQYPISGLSELVASYSLEKTGAFGRFSPEHCLARGGYGSIYLTKWYDGRQVIAKVNNCPNRKLVTYHEAAILAHLNGRGGAPKLIATCVDEGLVVMEYIKGVTVLQLMRENTLSDAQWLSVLCAVAKRLQEIHRAGIIHGDFKPDNCIITYDEEGNPDAHILDFGLSAKIGKKSSLARGPEKDCRPILKGRPWYAAEVFIGLPLQPATDVVGYSFLARCLARKIRRRCPEVDSLVADGMQFRMSKRPTLNDFLRVMGSR